MKNYNTAKVYFETVLTKYPTDKCEVTLNLNQVEITATYEDVNYIGFDRKSTSTEGG